MQSKQNPTAEELKNEIARLHLRLTELESAKNANRKREKPVRTLFRWQSFSRPYTRRDVRWFVYTLLLVAIIILVLLFIREFFIIAPVLALTFLSYALATVPPELIENSITTHGINTGGHSFIWEELDDFWFLEKRGFVSLNFDTFLPLQSRISILINKEDKEKIRQILARYRPYREIPKTTWIDNAADYLSNTFHKLTR